MGPFKNFLSIVSISILIVACSDPGRIDYPGIEPSNLPVLVIDTYGEQIKSEPKVNAKLIILESKEENSKSRFKSERFNIRIEERGLYSNRIPKKQYGFEVIDKNFQDLDAALLGMKAESDWVLYGPYSDKTLLRNFLAYSIYRQMGYYASDTRFVEIYLQNGDGKDVAYQYKGIYLLLEKIKRSPNRVNVAKMKSEEDVSFILEILPKERIADNDSCIFPVRSGLALKLIYPKSSSITQHQKKNIEAYINNFESSIYDKNSGSEHESKNLADLNNLADYLLFNEFVKNTDAFHASTFLHKSTDGLMKFGPVWDYNLAFGNIEFTKERLSHGWFLPQVDREWNNQFMEDPDMIIRLKERWKLLREEVINTNNIFQLIDQQIVNLEGSKQRNFNKWKIMGEKLWPNPEPVPASFEDEIDGLKTWISKRIEWMDNNIDQL